MIFKIIIHIIYKNTLSLVISQVFFFFLLYFMFSAKETKRATVRDDSFPLCHKKTTTHILYIYTLENPFYFGILILLFRSYIIM